MLKTVVFMALCVLCTRRLTLLLFGGFYVNLDGIFPWLSW